MFHHTHCSTALRDLPNSEEKKDPEKFDQGSYNKTQLWRIASRPVERKKGGKSFLRESKGGEGGCIIKYLVWYEVDACDVCVCVLGKVLHVDDESDRGEERIESRDRIPRGSTRQRREKEMETGQRI